MVTSGLDTGRGRGRAHRHPEETHSTTGGTTNRAGAAQHSAGPSGHLAARAPPAPAPEQHAWDGEVREGADAPRHQLQFGVCHCRVRACLWTSRRARRLRACAMAGRGVSVAGTTVWVLGVGLAVFCRKFPVSSVPSILRLLVISCTLNRCAPDSGTFGRDRSASCGRWHLASM